MDREVWGIMSEVSEEEKNILKMFIQDINTNTVNMNSEINSLSKISQEMIKEIKFLSQSISMNRVRANILEEIKLDISKIRPKKKSLDILNKINKYLYADFNF